MHHQLQPHNQQHLMHQHQDADLHSYPALLRQEKTMPGNISEYTHVWEVQAPSVMSDSGPPNTCPHLHTFKRVPQCEHHAREGCSCGSAGGGIYGTKESIYDTRRVMPIATNQSVNPASGQRDDGSMRNRNVPMYFDMDLTASIPQQVRGDTTPIRTLQLTNS